MIIDDMIDITRDIIEEEKIKGLSKLIFWLVAPVIWISGLFIGFVRGLIYYLTR